MDCGTRTHDVIGEGQNVLWAYSRTSGQNRQSRRIFGALAGAPAFLPMGEPRGLQPEVLLTESARPDSWRRAPSLPALPGLPARRNRRRRRLVRAAPRDSLPG